MKVAGEYKYHLTKWSERDKSLVCPQCHRGRGCFSEYVDIHGVPLDTENHLCGRCDHVNTCGYILTPSEWLKMNPEQREKKVKSIKPKKQMKPIRIEGKWVGAFYRNTKEKSNNFLKWIDSLPLNEVQRECLPTLIMMYAIGTTSDGRIIWWQIDEHKQVRTGKLMAYDNNGHRLKDEEGNSIGFGWVHSMFRKLYGWFNEKEYELQQCLFGQQLLPIVPDAEVHIVESEKTAFLMSIFDPMAMSKHIWMATGGLYNLSADKLRPLTGRTIVCYPDTNGVDKWREKLKGTGARLATDWISQTDEQDPKGADVGDVVLRRLLNKDQQPTQEQILERMEAKNPNLTKLIKAFNLTLK